MWHLSAHHIGREGCVCAHEEGIPMSDWGWLEEVEIEVERYELSPHARPLSQNRERGDGLSRRQFLAGLGAGLLVLSLVSRIEAQESGGGRRQRQGRPSAPREIGAWIHGGEDGAVTAFSGKGEVGQNARTALSLVVAGGLH